MTHNNHKMGSGESHRGSLCTTEAESKPGERLFDTDWEVFVARYDREKGQYVTKTFCCEDAVS